ncbi:MAG: transglycosylase SLT domain-containing protein [Proteobacteria bacterium]|nr:transglycosylase SLT domain-containing protein [Pseudomonadota bacterium]
MNKIILILFIITSLISCQSTKIKEIPAVEKISAKESINANNLLVSLNDCYAKQQCKEKLDPQLTSWLLEKNFIDIEIPAVTDELDSKQLLESATKQNPQILAKINLSSNYMDNELVRGALNEWLTWKRPQLINTWQYYQYLRQDIMPAFAKYNIEEAFILAIMAQESGGKVHSRSHAGAGGLFQLMPATAERLGLHGSQGAYDLRFNPKQSAVAAAKYIDEQNMLYDNDKTKVLAAYNSGENRVRRLNKIHKNKSLWNKNFYYDLPKETRHYVPVVIAAMLIFQDPDKFNVKLEALDVNVVTIKLAEKTSLSAVAFCLGQEQRVDGWFRILRNLNSGVKADKSIAANTDIVIPAILLDTFELNCKQEELMNFAQSFHDADFQGSTGLFRYKVQKGDTLSKIARKFRCANRKAIAKLNNLRAPKYMIRAGKYLQIPQC